MAASNEQVRSNNSGTSVLSWILPAVLVPIIVTAITQWSGIFSKSRELDIKMVEIGISILSADPKETQVAPARAWAIEVIEQYGRVKFAAEDRKNLLANQLQVAAAPAPAANTSSESWVAVGILDSSNASDANFTLVNGSVLPSSLAVNSVIKAKTQVNIRPSAAGWTSVNGVLAAGQCFLVLENSGLEHGRSTSNLGKRSHSTV